MCGDQAMMGQGPKKAKRAGIRGIEIEPVMNGFTLTTRYKTEPSGVYDPEAERESSVHENAKSLMTAIRSKMATSGGLTSRDARVAIAAAGLKGDESA